MRDRALGIDDLPFPLARPLTGQDILALFPRLLQPLWSRAASAFVAFSGTVASVNAGQPKTVTVTLGDGTTVDARYYTTYTPTVGDRVEGLTNGTVTRVLGKPA